MSERTGWSRRLVVAAEGQVGHAGVVLLHQVADRVGLTAALAGLFPVGGAQPGVTARTWSWPWPAASCWGRRTRRNRVKGGPVAIARNRARHAPESTFTQVAEVQVQRGWRRHLCSTRHRRRVAPTCVRVTPPRPLSSPRRWRCVLSSVASRRRGRAADRARARCAWSAVPRAAWRRTRHPRAVFCPEPMASETMAAWPP